MSAVFLLPLVFWPHAAGAFLLDKNFVLWAVVAFALGLRLLRRGFASLWPEAKRSRRVSVTLAAFFAWFLLSLLWAVNRPAGWDYLLTLLGPALFLPLCLDRGERFWRQGLLMLVAATGLAAFYGVCQGLGLDIMPWNYAFRGRAFSTMGNPNFLAGLVIMVLPLVLAYLLRARRAGLVSCLGLLALLLVALYQSKTRGAWLALAAAMLLFLTAGFLLLRGREKRRLSMLSGCVAVAVVLGLLLRPGLFSRLGSAFSPESESVASRLAIFGNTWQMARDHLLAGVGIGNFKIFYPLYQASGVEAEELWRTPYIYTEHTHNEYLQFLAEGGTPALVFFSLFLFLLGRFFLRRLRGAAGGRNNLALLAVACGIFAAAMFALVNFPFQLTTTAFVFFIFAAYLLSGPGPGLPARVASGRERQGEGDDKVSYHPGGITASLALFLVVVYLGYDFAADHHRRLGGGEEGLYRQEAAKGDLRAARWHYEQAVKHQRRTLAMKGSDFKTAYSLSFLEAVKGGNEEALSLLSRCLEYSPYKAEAYRQRGLTHGQMGRNREALVDLARAYEIAPNYMYRFPQDVSNVGAYYEMKGEGEKAEECFRLAVKSAPNIFAVRRNYIVFLYKHRRMLEAERELAEAKRLFPLQPGPRELEKALGMSR